MNAIFLTLFVSAALLGGAGILFGFLFQKRSHEYADRLSLLPLDGEESVSAAQPTATFPEKEVRS